MGTRSLTTFIEIYEDENGKKRKNEIVTMYRQYDGYPSGHGEELAEFLSKGKLVNGIGLGDDLVFNGMGCLSAQVVAHFKNGAGGIYLQRANKNSWENYRYHVIGDYNSKNIKLVVYEVNRIARKIFEGTPQEFLTKVKSGVLS